MPDAGRVVTGVAGGLRLEAPGAGIKPPVSRYERLDHLAMELVHRYIMLQRQQHNLPIRRILGRSTF